ncbi:hypothetical protein P8605_49705, partial [Streptomyces sp. T-3]|nr:hypothetical protein [Streptomyces sp. T-3]
ALGTPPAAAERTLQPLVAAGILAPHPDQNGLQFPLPQRLFAVEQLKREAPSQVRAAIARLSAAAAGQVESAQLSPRVDGMHPLDWFARRQESLVTLTGRAHGSGLWAQTVRLVDAMAAFLEALAAWDAWQYTHGLALEAAERTGDRAAEIRLLRSLGDLAWQRHRPLQAQDFYQRALGAADNAPVGPPAPERG